LLAVLYINTIYLAALDSAIILSMRGADYINDDNARIALAAWIAWVVAFLVFAVLNLFQAVKLSKHNDIAELRKRMKLLKLGAVPYFVLNFVLAGGLFVFFFAVSHGFGIFFVPVPLFFTWTISLATSVYGMGFVAVLNRSGRDAGTSLPMNMVMQFCLVLDIVSTVILLRESRDI
jgi:hypothetical protein